MAYDAPDEPGSENLRGKVEQTAPDLPAEEEEVTPPSSEELLAAEPPEMPEYGKPGT